MLHSLRLRLLLALVLVVAVAISLVSVVGGVAATRMFREYLQGRFERDHLVAASALQNAGRDGSLPALQAGAEELSRAMGSEIILVNAEGDVLVDSQGTLIGKTLFLPPFTSAAPGQGGEAAAPGQVEAAQGEPPVILMIRGEAGGAGAGGPFVIPVPVAGGARRFEPRLFGSLNRSFLLAAAGSGLGALGLALLLSRRIVGPIEALTVAARRLEQGDLTQRVRVSGRDEIGELGQAFNAMAEGLARQENLRRTLVADVAHELRTPLANIRGYLEAVRDGVVQPEPQVVESLYEEAMLLNRLADDLQELALAEAGQIALGRKPTPVQPIIERALAACAPHLEARQITAAVRVPPELPAVLADPERIGQVLRNLLVNAAHYAPEQGQVEVAARAAGGMVEVSVQDNGPGIPAEHLPNVFERFYRADGSRTRSTGGAGLGLAIVKQLVETHGGRVWVESAAGRGTKFSFTLPLAGEAAQPAVAG